MHKPAVPRPYIKLQKPKLPKPRNVTVESETKLNSQHIIMVVVSNDQCQDSCTREISESETDVPQNQVMGSISPNGILTKGRVGGESSKPRIHTDVDSFSNPTLYSLPTEVLETVLEQVRY